MSAGRLFLLVGACAVLALLVFPFLGFAIATSWAHLRPFRGDLESVRVSVGYTLLALLVIIAIGTPLAYWLAHNRFRGKVVVEALVLLPLLTPPLAMGILLAVFYGPYSWAGRAAGRLGV